MDNLFSEGELAIVRSGVSNNFRIDGRSCFDIRQTKICASVLSSCNGSARALANQCSLIVGVKAEIGPPREDPPRGIVEISVEGRGQEETAEELSILLTNAITPVIDRESLCISTGKVWIFYVDVLVLEGACESQLIDLASVCIKAALQDTRVPKIIADEENADDFILQPEEYCPFNVPDLPILITLTRIEDSYVADATEEEETAGIARLTMAFNDRGELSYTRKSGTGSLQPEPLKHVLHEATQLAMSIHRDLDNQLKQSTDSIKS